MATIQQRDTPTKLFLRRLGILGLFVLVLFTAWSVWGAARKNNESARLNSQSQAALADLTAQDAQLKRNIATLESERGREAALRQSYAVGKPGENMIVIVDHAPPPPPPPAPSFMDRLKRTFVWW